MKTFSVFENRKKNSYRTKVVEAENETDAIKKFIEMDILFDEESGGSEIYVHECAIKPLVKEGVIGN